MTKPTHKRHLDDQGHLQYETWKLNDLFHRTDGPAIIYYRPDGTVEYEQWCLHGKLHRADGPAYTSYWPDGTVRYEQWCLLGKTLTEEQHVAQTQQGKHMNPFIGLQVSYSTVRQNSAFVNEVVVGEGHIIDKQGSVVTIMHEDGSMIRVTLEECMFIRPLYAKERLCSQT